MAKARQYVKSTTVEIILYYLTLEKNEHPKTSTTVEIILYYLTDLEESIARNLQQ